MEMLPALDVLLASIAENDNQDNIQSSNVAAKQHSGNDIPIQIQACNSMKRSQLAMGAFDFSTSRGTIWSKQS
jgi:hypothetical protein